MNSERGEIELKVEMLTKIDELEGLVHEAMLELKIMLAQADKETILDMMPLLNLLIRAIKRMKRAPEVLAYRG